MIEAEAPPAWFRESVERVFKVGDRVRINVSPECDYCEEHWRRGLNGTTGVVRQVGHDDDPNDGRDHAWARQYAAHHFWVHLDGRDVDDLIQFAAAELVPATSAHAVEQGDS